MPTPPANPGIAFSGKVMAGSQPIAEAAIQVYAAGTTGNGSTPTALLTTALTTDATGAFTVPANYSCPTNSSQLYVVARGGKVGTSSTSNTAITLATVVGPCSQIATSTQLILNEVTTAATVWGLSQFLASGASLGASSSNTQGLINAVATVTNLANLTTGTSPGTSFPSGAASPAAKVNTLANLLNTCTAATIDLSPCSSLFTASTPAGASAPANTFDAALNLVRNPGTNVTAFYQQSRTSTAFTPALATAPSDWTLFVSYTGGGLFEPGGLGIDSMGNVWVSNYIDSTGTVGVVSKFSPTGTPIFPAGILASGLSSSYGLAIDVSDNVWIPYEQSPSNLNRGLGAVSVLNSNGQSISGSTGYSTGGLFYPIAVSIDPNGTAWVVNYGNAHLTQYSSTGQVLSGDTGLFAPSFAFPAAIVVDANHNAWIGDQNDSFITRISSDGTQNLPVSCCNSPNGLAIDQRGYIWAANYAGDSVSQVSGTGTVFSNGYTGGGLDHPQGIAIDGAGTVWIANYRSTALTQLAGSSSSNPGADLSPATGWAPDAVLSPASVSTPAVKLLEAFAIAIDASGNLWVTNFGSNSLTEYIGLAVPVRTPRIGPPQTP
ncbi:MAG TPA: NHL repeat-containing protein [Edaphobacter sp.]